MTIDRHGEPIERKLIQFAFLPREGNLSHKRMIVFSIFPEKRKAKVFEIEGIEFIRTRRSKLRNHECKVQSYIVQERETAAVTHTRFTIENGNAFFHAFSRNRVEASVLFFFLLSATNGNNRLVNYGKISNSFSRELLSKRKEKKKKKNLSLALVFPRCEFRSISRADPESKKRRHPLENRTSSFPLLRPFYPFQSRIFSFSLSAIVSLSSSIVPDTREFIRNA